MIRTRWDRVCEKISKFFTCERFSLLSTLHVLSKPFCESKNQLKIFFSKVDICDLGCWKVDPMLGIDQWVPKRHPKSLVLMSYSCYRKNIDHERYRYIEYNLEDRMNTILGYKKRLKVIEDMIHIDYITIISYIHTHSSISHNVETIHPKVITYFTVLCINVWKKVKIPFLVTKRGQNLISISDSDPRPPNCIWLYLLLSFQSDWNIENLRGGNPLPPCSFWSDDLRAFFVVRIFVY